MVLETDLSDYTRFFGRYSRFVSEWTDTRIDTFTTRFGHLRTGLEAINGLVRERQRLTAPNHNIFRTLGVHWDEDRTHTPVLASLLDPLGEHAQGHLYLREFLAQCSTKPGARLPRGDVTAGNWYVETQKVTSFGNLDLVLACPALGYLAVVENKIRAREQELQLNRYSDWLKTQERFYADRVLIYLTPQGVDSDTAEGCDYLRLSYAKDITEVLERAIAQTEASSVQSTLRQYLHIVRTVVATL